MYLHKIMVYFNNEADMQIWARIDAFAKNEKIAWSSAILRMLHGNKVRDDVIAAHKKEIKRLQAKIETLTILLEIEDPKSKAIVVRAMRHQEKAKRLEASKGLAEALVWHQRHKGKKEGEEE